MSGTKRSRIRAVAALAALVSMASVSATAKMDGRFTSRQSMIRKVMSENSIVNIARVIRDLSGRRRRRKTLSKTEDSALRELTDRLLSEWSVALGVDEAEAREKLKALLEEDSNA